jgi:hypothetical protein
MRPLDFDPRGLPVRYSLPVRNGADHGRAARDLIEIRPGLVAVEHEVPGFSSVRRAFAWEEFSGIAIRIECLDDSADNFAVSVNLHHADPKLCFPLYMSLETGEAGHRWHGWGRVLKLPLLLPTADGGWREPIERFGKLIVNPPCARPPRLALARRRSCFSSIRELGDPRLIAQIGGQEIIART